MKHVYIAAVVALFLALWPQAMHAGGQGGNVDLTSRRGCLAAIDYAESHLGNPADGQHNEQAYLDLLEQIAASGHLTGDDALRPQYLLEDARKNRIGSAAADFDFVTADGVEHRLSDYQAPEILIYFNDPDCDACRLVKARLDTCQAIKQRVESGSLAVIAVYTLDDEQAWRRATYPSYMVNGWNRSQSIDDGLYSLPSMPLFYLLDSDKKVLLKNEPSLNAVLSALAKTR